MTATLRFDPAPLPPCPPGGPDRADLRESIGRWVRSEAMAALVRAFGGEPPGPRAEPGEALAALDSFAAVWDYRGGRERRDVVPLAYDPWVEELIVAAAAALGQAGHDRPLAAAYHHLLVLGGGPRSAVARSRVAAELIAAGRCAGEVSVLSGSRALSEAEQAVALRLGLPATKTEAEMMAAGLAQALDLSMPPDRREGLDENGSPWSVWTYRTADLTAHVLAAPPAEPGRRAHTGDGFEGWARYVAAPSARDRVLAISTDIYVPAQHCDGVRTLGLGHGCAVETIGPRAADHPNVLIPPPTSALLLEVRSAIRAMRRLLAACG